MQTHQHPSCEHCERVSFHCKPPGKLAPSYLPLHPPPSLPPYPRKQERHRAQWEKDQASKVRLNKCGPSREAFETRMMERRQQDLVLRREEAVAAARLHRRRNRIERARKAKMEDEMARQEEEQRVRDEQEAEEMRRYDEQEAARAYDAAARRLRPKSKAHGELSGNKRTRLNFPTAQEAYAARQGMLPSAGAPSAFLGVSRPKKGTRWQAKIKHEGTDHYLGLFDDDQEEEA